MIDQIGQTVHLNSSKYPIDEYNPRKTAGVIIGLNKRRGFNPLIVEWRNGIRNSYQLKDLKII